MNWSKIIRRTILIAVTTVVALTGMAYVSIHTNLAEHLILKKVVQVAEARSGARVEIRRLAIPWTHLGADLYGVTVFGKGGTSKPPLFQTAYLEITLDTASLFMGRIGITNLVLDRPVVHFNVNRKGQTNLPKSPAVAKLLTPVKTPFHLSIRHVAIEDGRIYCNDTRMPVSANLADFGVHVNFNTRLSEYKGSLRYKQGRIIWGTFSPIEHSLQAQFVVSRTGLTINPLRVRTWKSHLTVDARVVDYANPRVQGRYEAALYTPEFAEILHSSSLPVGEVMMAGTMQYRKGRGALFDELRVEGRIRSPRLVLHAGQVSVDINSVRGAYALDRGKLTVANLQANTLGGIFDVKSGVLSLPGLSSSRLNVVWQGVSLQDVVAASRSRNYQRLHILGSARGDAKISWSNSIHDLMVQSHVRLYEQANAHVSGTRIPVSGIVDMRYNAARCSVFFRKSRLRIGNTRLSLNGRLSKRSNLSVKLETGNLRNFNTLLQTVEAAKYVKSPFAAPLNLQGSAEFAGRVTGPPRNPRIQGRISAHDLEVAGTHWRSIATNVDLASSQIVLKNGVMVANRRGQIHFDAIAGLRQWKFADTRAVSIEATATGIPITSLERLANTNYPIKGMLSGSFSVQGTVQNPRGHGRVQIVKASAWNQPIERIALDFKGNGNSILSTARIQTSAGDLNARLTYFPLNRQYNLVANTSGLELDRLQVLEAGNSGIKGTLKLSASGRGTIENPELCVNLTISKLRVRSQSISSLQSKVNIADHHANFTTQLIADQGTALVRGQVALTGEYDATATLDAHGFSIEPLVAFYSKTKQHELKGETDIHAEFSGPLKDPARIEARVKIPKLNLAYKGTQVALVRPLRLIYRKGVATLEETELKGTGTDFVVRGKIPVEKQTSMNVAVNGTVALSLLQAMTSGVNSSGQLQVQLVARGNLLHPKTEGNIRIEKAEFSSASMPVELDNVNGQIRVSGDRIEIQSLTGDVDGGSMSAQGFVIYGTPPRFNLAVTANSVTVPYPHGLRTVVSCNLQFNGTKANSLLSGRVVIDQLMLTRQFELTSLMGQFASGPSLSTPSPFEKNVKLDVVVQTAHALRLASSQLNARGGADLTLTRTLARPVVLGRATLEHGEIFFLGRRYDIQSGTFEFSNPMRTNPIVNLYVTTTVDQYKITMNLDGPINRMITSYTSDPPLPPSDIINLIAFGSTPQQAGASPAAPGVLGAESVLAKGAASQVTGKIEKLAGISQLTINPLIGYSQQNPGAQISIQQQVTGRLLLTFSTDTNETQNTAVELQYRLSHGVSVAALRGQYGGYGIDIHFHKSF